MEGGDGIRDESSQLSEHQITDKNIASVLQEAISRVAFEQDAKIDEIEQPGNAALGFKNANNATSKEQIQPQQDESESIISSASQSAGLFEQEVTALRQQDVTSQFVTKPDVYGRGQQQPVGQETKERKDTSRPSQTAGNPEMIEQLSKKNERLRSLNIELHEKLLQQIKDTESGAREIARISKEVQEHTKQIMKLTKRNDKLTSMLEKLREENSRLKKRNKKPAARETRSTRKKKVKIKEEEEEEPGEEERNSKEEDVPDADLDEARDNNDNSDDPDYQVQNEDDDDSDKGELRKDLKHEEDQECEAERNDNAELPKLNKGSSRKPFSCNLCLAAYRTKGFLKAHQKRAHLGTPERRGRGRRKSAPRDRDETETDKDETEVDADSAQQEERKNKCLYCSARFKKACHLYRHERQIHRVQSLNRRNKIQYIPGTDNYVVGITPATKKPIKEKEPDGAMDEMAETADNSDMDCAAEESLPNELPSDLEELKKLPQIKVKKGFRCILCNKVFTQSCHLRRHERVVHRGERFFPCEICKKMFPDRSGLKEHMKVHSDAKEFSCDLCDKSYKYSQKLRLHMQTHTGVKPFMCSVCGNTYSTKSYLKEHEVLHTGVKPYACKYCSKTFAQSSALKIHEKIHTGEKNHRCQYCGWAFITVQKMREHEYTHTGEKPYQCKYCPKSFRTGIALKSHERLHTGERPYRCTICGKAFTQHPHLKSHILIHTGERPHKCKHCGKGFMTRGHLASHESVHTGLKPHKCEKCDKSFAKGNHLVRHMRIHTGEKPFICSHCGRGFSRSELLRTHEKQQHGIEHEKRTYPKLIVPTKEELVTTDPTMLVAAPDMTSSMTNVAMDIGQEVIYQNLPPGQSVPPHHPPHPPHHQAQGGVKAQQADGVHSTQPGSSHVIIPGLGEQLYQESLAKSKQDPSGISVSSIPVEQYWTPAQVSQYMESYPTNH